MLLPLLIDSGEVESSDADYDIVGAWYGIHSYYNPVGGTKFQYLTIEFRDDYSVRAWRPKYEDGTGTYSVDGNNVVFDLVQPTWAKFESATFTSTSMVVQYRYVFSDGSIGDHIYERTYIKQ